VPDRVSHRTRARCASNGDTARTSEVVCDCAGDGRLSFGSTAHAKTRPRAACKWATRCAAWVARARPIDR